MGFWSSSNRLGPRDSTRWPLPQKTEDCESTAGEGLGCSARDPEADAGGFRRPTPEQNHRPGVLPNPCFLCASLCSVCSGFCSPLPCFFFCNSLLFFVRLRSLVLHVSIICVSTFCSCFSFSFFNWCNMSFLWFLFCSSLFTPAGSTHMPLSTLAGCTRGTSRLMRASVTCT